MQGTLLSVMIHRFIVDEGDADTRLDVFLSSKIPTMTRSAIAKLLKSGAGRVNGTIASVHRFLKAGDEVVFDDAPTDVRAIHESPLRTTSVPDIHIIAETDGWMVIDKPAGLLVHPDATTKTGTLVDALLARDPAIAKIGDDPSRPGIMHRLDRDVSGLMVIAKTQDAFYDLKRQFAEHSVDKRYLALVHGKIAKDEGDVKFRIARSKTKARMAARPESEDAGKAAWTHYKVLRRFRGATLLELAILSGRTHQIRAHLLALGHPVMGDTLYAIQKAKSKKRTSMAPRLMLQAVELAFDDPATDNRRRFTIPPNPAFEKIMSELK